MVKLQDLSEGDIFAGYRIEQILGEGGMGVVYLAQHLGLGRKVALKLLATSLAGDGKFRERFVRESKLAASLDDPNVIPIYEAGEHEGRLYLAMRYVEGTDLQSLLDAEGALNPARTVAIVSQVASALDAAHDHGLIHRDVKPANILLAAKAGGRSAEHVYLTDFGLTKRAASGSGMTAVGQFLGSIEYASPEQIQSGELTPKTDVYSLGCVLYQTLTGTAPFPRDTDIAVIYAHLNDAPPRPSESQPDLPSAVDEVVARAMAKNADDRYASAGDLATAAGDALGLGTLASETVATGRRRRAHRRRRRLLTAAIAGAVVIALVAVVLPRIVGGGSENGLAALPSGMVLLDAKTGRERSFVPPSSVKTPVEAIYAEGEFWVLNLDPISISEIDPRTGKIRRVINSPFDDLGFYAVSGPDLFVGDATAPKVAKIDIKSGKVLDRWQVSDDPSAGGVNVGVVADGSLWATVGFQQVLRIDPQTGEVQKRFDRMFGARSISYGDGSIWIIALPGVDRIDPKSNTVVKTAIPANLAYTAAGGGFGWTASEAKGVVYKVDRNGHVADTYQTGLGARVVSYSDGVLWVGNQDVGTLTGIDAVTGHQTTYRFSHPLQAVAAGSGEVLVQLNPGRTYEDAIDVLQGKVAKFFIEELHVDQPDPALTFSSVGFQIENATCAKLLNYPDKPAPQGWSLQPEVAGSMPQVSDDGRTYTFTVRPGYQFSPPSNQKVTAETFRNSIERALAPGLGDERPGPHFIDDIEGEQPFLDDKAAHISGLRASGDQLSITLVKPSGNFLERLNLPFFCAVPTDAAAVPGGNGERSSTTQIGRAASAGPYYVAEHFSGEYLILKRNPNYRGPRPHPLDAIALREGVDPGVALQRVQSGGWSGVLDEVDELFYPGSALASRWGPGSAAAAKADQRYYPVINDGEWLLEFNGTRPAFADPQVRRAAALGLDRQALTITLHSTPAAEVLTPDLRGASAGSQPVPSPNLTEARALMGGRHVTAIMPTSSADFCPECVQASEAIKAQLAEIGIDVRIKEVDNSYDYAHAPGAKADLRLGGWDIDPLELTDTAHDLHDMFGPSGFGNWFPKRIQDAAVALDGVPAAQRDAAARDFLTLAASQVPLTMLAHRVDGSFLSPKLGCRVFPPYGWGLDLASLCLL